MQEHSPAADVNQGAADGHAVIPGTESEQLRDRILTALLSERDGYVSGEHLSEVTGVSRTAVWKHIKHLERLGFRFEAAHRLGYRLVETPDLLMAPLLAQYLPKEASFGKHVRWLPSCDSTNKTAMGLAGAGAPHGTLVTAWEQTGGRGRRGRAWFSPQGGLWMSLILQHPIALSRAAELTLLCSVAVRRAIRATCGASPDIKWPNDLLMGGRKICGILAEIRADGETVQHAVLGIGINSNIPATAFPPDLLAIATSLAIETDSTIHNLTLAAAILKELEPMYRDLEAGGAGFQAVAGEWRAASATLGRHIRVQTASKVLEGDAVDVDDSGVLYLRVDSGQVIPVHSGDVLFS
ncbi:biotin--[acetyl-CoA-carboxylase] ligase [Alicyclobacillus cycloheptanicus]|uniref:Bifunctional ligase/repressor BirA n=1 Tax=Alicyclobacillus cycloheptanicus TaxID=1457 RepID=A0ABT9XEL5_9BACL|nr:biotin--[acetyl-CoA-carboxylase] ligase [Alicyclobacillus cycloheptanicus]MDQ0188570.1 BirA family biotin operon repressor/biotin-[acetyl-CoA-carboxylase] ligase [Alicyclobacillus cycloheptanicus]WDM01251.1 biotin--[acetyl-CoA-carboxylase] ligase [Alicyclobacillus cycloheptanicus]